MLTLVVCLTNSDDLSKCKYKCVTFGIFEYFWEMKRCCLQYNEQRFKSLYIPLFMVQLFTHRIWKKNVECFTSQWYFNGDISFEIYRVLLSPTFYKLKNLIYFVCNFTIFLQRSELLQALVPFSEVISNALVQKRPL